MDDVNKSGSHELRPLDSTNNIGLRMIQMILSHEPIDDPTLGSLACKGIKKIYT